MIGGPCCCRKQDLDTYDYIVGMDGANKAAVLEAAHYWGKKDVAEAKLRNMTSFCTKHQSATVVSVYTAISLLSLCGCS